MFYRCDINPRRWSWLIAIFVGGSVLLVVSTPVGAMVRNGSFEQQVPGMYPAIPAFWFEARQDVHDTYALVTNAAEAHWGRRCVKLYGHGEKGVRLHAWGSEIELDEAKTYTVRLWARAERGKRAMLFVQPGHGEVQLSHRWRQYHFDHGHETKAGKPRGLAIRVVGGPAYVDDVGISLKELEPVVAPELEADYSKLRSLPVDWTWRSASNEPTWQHRIVISVSEVVGKPVASHTVELPLRGILPGFRFDDVCAERIRVVDASRSPTKLVKFSLLKTKTDLVRAQGRTGWDRLAFLADCPPSSTKTYFVYVARRQPDGRTVNWPYTLPVNWPKGTYPYQLEVLYRPQNRTEVNGHTEGRQIALRLRNWTAISAKAQIVSPDGNHRFALRLQVQRGEPGSWSSLRGAFMPSDAIEGVWNVLATFTDRSGRTETVWAPLLYGWTIWAAHHTEKVFSNDSPRYGTSGIRLSAARNEREVFQAVVSSTRDLNGVRLTATDLIGANESNRIPASRFDFSRVDHVDLSSPIAGPTGLITGFGAFAYDGRGGPHPDPLLPWRSHVVPAHTQRVAWVSLKVPKDTRAGLYWGSILASAEGNEPRRLPVAVRVYDFDLPDVRTFTPVLGGDVGRDPDRVMAVAELFGSRGVTPFYYSQSRSPYPAPWTFDPSEGTAKFDFSIFDRCARHLLEEGGVKYLFLASEYHPGGKKRKAIYERGADHRIVRRAKNGTPQANAMWRAWARGMGRHLKDLGWLGKAYVYLADEPADQSLLPVMDEIARLLKETQPIQTFVAAAGCYGSGWGPWHEYLNRTDVFSGTMSAENRTKLESMGGEYWGIYNRAWFVGGPLATQRMIGLDSWLDGVSHYFHWAMSNLRHNRWRVEPNRVKLYGAIGDYPAGTFLRFAASCGTGNAVYFWPDDEPAPPGKSKSVASSMRLDSLSEGIDDYEYMEILKKAAEATAADSPMRRRYRQLHEELKHLVNKARIGGSYTHPNRAWTYFEIDPQTLEQFREQVALAIENGGLSR